MAAPTSEQMRAVYEVETPGGDTYGLGVGHLVMPNGSLIAVSQRDDATAGALVHAYRDVILNSSAKEHTCNA